MSPNGVMTLPAASAAAITLPPSALPPFGVSEIRKRTHAIQEVMRGVMQVGVHFGTIPGTPKPSLWKPGAEVLCMTFRLAPLLESRVTRDESEAEWDYVSARRDGSIVNGTCLGFFEVEATCTIQGPGGEILSRCSARCNNREAKYRSMSMFDIRNTVQKMAEKRAFVSAVLMATGASDNFSQDLEELPDLSEAQVRPAPLVPSNGMPVSKGKEPRSPLPPAGKQGMTPKREAWLLRVAQEGGTSPEALERCRAHLSAASSIEVSKFFDQLSKSGVSALGRFL